MDSASFQVVLLVVVMVTMWGFPGWNWRDGESEDSGPRALILISFGAESLNQFEMMQ